MDGTTRNSMDGTPHTPDTSDEGRPPKPIGQLAGRLIARPCSQVPGEPQVDTPEPNHSSSLTPLHGSTANAGSIQTSLSSTATAARQALTERESQQLVAASLERLLGSLPAVNTRSWTGDDGQFDSEITSIDLPNAASGALERAWAEVGPLCRPALAEPNGEALVAQEWARTIAVTAGTQRQGVDEDLAVEVVVGEVSRYPLDCVMRAMRARRNGYRWRPTLSELLGDIQWRARYRMALREAFQRSGVEAAR